MQPALEILGVHGSALGLNGPHEFFWWTGFLSSVLDNAPTYVVFFETAAASPQFAGHAFHEMVAQSGESGDSARQLLVAISVGSVFMGSMTYIGNGPNFMVRAIAEQAGVPMPSFFGYALRFSIPWLIPVFLLVNWILF
jgi:Na+/H+ antiporter NhaD/arsenite permease-like protein